MINYGLPTSVTIGENEWEIRSDYRAILDIMTALNDVELDDTERAIIVLTIFYPKFDDMDANDYREGLERCFEFMEGGERKQANAKPSTVDWEQDFQYIIAPVNAVAGKEIRVLEYLHWWTFLSYYMEIDGECTFAQIVSIRDKMARGKALDKSEREWYNRNRELVDRKTKYTQAEEEILKQWGGMNG